MGIRSTLERHPLVAIASTFAAGATLAWTVATEVRIKPLEAEITQLRSQQREIGKSQPLPRASVDDIYKTYEWQWAGENWYGRITLAEKDGAGFVAAARVGFLKKLYVRTGESTFRMSAKILELADGPSSAELKENGDLAISMWVRKSVDYQPTYAKQQISGVLHPRRCYAGEVDYWISETESDRGDMILVAYASMRSADNVDKFFR